MDRNIGMENKRTGFAQKVKVYLDKLLITHKVNMLSLCGKYQM